MGVSEGGKEKSELDLTNATGHQIFLRIPACCFRTRLFKNLNITILRCQKSIRFLKSLQCEFGCTYQLKSKQK